jgi:PilZ domain
MADMQIELHGRTCSCRGGSWVIVDPKAGSPCSSSSGDQSSRVTLTFSEWKSLGKPASAEEHADAVARATGGDRREFDRFAIALNVRLSRLPSWRNETAQTENTVTEVIAKGGALVRSRMAVEKGETLHFEIARAFKTRAEVMYLSGGAGALRLGLRFLDALLPDHLIPADARPLRET